MNRKLILKLKEMGNDKLTYTHEARLVFKQAAKQIEELDDRILELTERVDTILLNMGSLP